MNPTLTVEKLEKSMAKLTIEVPAKELEQAIEKAYLKNRGRISVPGFRKGKVPRPMIEKMYGPEIFYEDAANLLIPEAYEAALEDCTEEIVSSPKIEVITIEAGEAFVFTATVALKPEISLGKYKGVKIEKLDSNVSDEEVDAAIDREREQNARNVAVEDRSVEDGDMIILDFEGFVDDVPFAGGKAEDYSLSIGSGAFIPGFEDQLIGAELGQEMDVTVTFPEDYNAPGLAGKEAVFKCTVKEIKVKELPDLDDEFASEVSEFDTLAEYRSSIAEKLATEKEQVNREKKEDAVIEAIIADSDIEIPEPMLETQKRQLLDEFSQRLAMQGMELSQYLQFSGMSFDVMQKQMETKADINIRSRLVLEAVAEAENLTVGDADVEAEMERLAELYGIELDKVKERFGEEENKSVIRDLAVKKAVDFVVEHAKEK